MGVSALVSREGRDAPELVEALVLGVAEITEAETEHWITYFSTSVAALRQQANPGVSSAQDLFTWGSKDGFTTRYAVFIILFLCGGR